MAERRRMARKESAGRKAATQVTTNPVVPTVSFAEAPAAMHVGAAVVEPADELPADDPTDDALQVQETARRAVEERTRLLLSGLRELGYRAKEAREAAEFGVGHLDLSLEDQMKRALSWFRPRTTRAAE